MRYLKNTLLLAGAVVLAACADRSPVGPGSDRSTAEAPLFTASPDVAVEGAYIVVLKEGGNPRAVAAVAGVTPRYVYENALKGFAARLNAGQLNALRHYPGVAHIEQDQRGGIATTQYGATWGLDRIDQRNLPLNGNYVYNATAPDVYAYVIDTGLQANHPEFGGRAMNVYDYAGGSGEDCQGHGTHVAGTIGSTTYGVAKQVRLRGLRTIDCFGYGDISVTIAAVDWLTLYHAKPAVVNMSLRWGYSASMNAAVTSLSNAGVLVAVAAGNENLSACNYSPASTPAALTSAASTSGDAKASFSNYGSCVDLYGPGQSITSTTINSGTSTLSGTSMASPHTAGVAALYKATYGDQPSATVHNWIVNNATVGVISGNPTGTPNRLLYTVTGAAGRTGIHRLFSQNADDHLYGLNPNEGAQWGYVLEAANYFYLESASAAGHVPLYRCYHPQTHDHFLSTSANCEGFTNEGLLGYIATSQTAGTSPLYRLYRPSTGNTFYTTSATEANNAVSWYSYTHQGVTGYVYSTP